MYTTKSGQKFGSAMVGKKKDAMGSENKAMPFGESKEEPRTNVMGEAKHSSKEAVAPDNDVKANPEGVDAGAVAAEHGPAEHVHIHHNHAANKHHVISHHPDGHMHMSDHDSAPDAHKAAAQLGGEANTENSNAAPNADAGKGDMFGGDGFSMPSLD
jgi:hypothetical protein